MSTVCNILALDGGGVRGVMEMVLLEEIESRTNQNVAELFQLIVGSSAGSIGALAFAVPGSDGKPKYSATEIRSIFEENAETVFPYSEWRNAMAYFTCKYSADGIESLAKKFFGDITMNQAVCDVLVPTMEIYSTKKPWVMPGGPCAASNPTLGALLMSDVMLMSTAAPSYLPPRQITIDGKQLVFTDGSLPASNPANEAYAESIKLGLKKPDTKVTLLSIGTGKNTDDAISYDTCKDWGETQWASPVLDCIFAGSEEIVNEEMTDILGSDFVRIQFPTTKAVSELDNPANIPQLEAIAKAYIDAHGDQLEDLCRKLTGENLASAAI
jgi:patatin-like phospholipase/acyl hydrolase